MSKLCDEKSLVNERWIGYDKNRRERVIEDGGVPSMNEPMMFRKKLPIGIENFKEIRQPEYYYVDKTNLIKELLTNAGKVNLFTRPRRFGKTLNMSMLQHFFEVGSDKTLFDGLNIAKEKEICDAYMGKFPVVSVSLKDVSGLTFESACNKLKRIIGTEAIRFSFLADSPNLEPTEKAMYKELLKFENGVFAMTEDALCGSLCTLTKLLEKHYGSAVVLLVDEYDVPLDKAFHAGFYNEMVTLIRDLLSIALKSNPSLQFAVLTGCLRISKESIFTGLNNLKVFSITDVQFDEYFGFTDKEVKEMLEYYGYLDHFHEVKEWYDGYKFGNVSVYCPWDVIMYGYELRTNPDAEPQAYWINTSSNSIVKRFIHKATKRTQNEIEKLIAGEGVWKSVHQDLTYNELDKSIDHLWSVLFTTGYLTQSERNGKNYLLTIPNKEVQQIFIEQVKEWFSEITVQDMSSIYAFANAFKIGDVETIEEMFTSYLKKTISIRDTSVAKSKKENFYHGILLGLFAPMGDWIVSSNAESGEGYSDILIEIPDDEIGIVIEVKYGDKGQLEDACQEALKQIEEKNYVERLEDNGMETIFKYGIGCYQKKCKVILGE